MSNASMKEQTGALSIHEVILIMRRSKNTVHAISWVSLPAHRVVRSKFTAELLAATDAVDRIAYLKHLTEEVSRTKKRELIRDSKWTFHLCSTLSEPEEAKNQLVLAAIRQGDTEKSSATIR